MKRWDFFLSVYMVNCLTILICLSHGCDLFVVAVTTYVEVVAVASR